MQEKIKTYFGPIADAYILAITVVLPLYLKDRYSRIGDAKYDFYMRVSLLFLVCWMVGVICLAVGKRAAARQSRQWSLLDSMVLLYGCSVIVSYCFSAYKQTALFGYSDWHMGMVTQLLLVWSYFFVSRFYTGERKLWSLMAAAAFIVFAIGVLNRYVYDPLGCFKDIAMDDWNHLNLLSTMGNVNWYCGYVCLTLPLLLYFFWSGRGSARVLGGFGSLVGFVTLFTQGSDSGYVGAAAILVVLLLVSLTDWKKIIRFLQVLLLFTLTPVLISITLPVMPRGLQLPEDTTGYVIFWKGWAALALLAAVLLAGCMRKRKEGKVLSGRKLQKIVVCSLLSLCAAGSLLMVLCQVSEEFWQCLGGCQILKMDADWGSGRGVLWKLSLQCLLRENLLQKLFGAGPDCFACIMGEMFDMEREIFVSGQWKGAVFANAHNEWLNVLITCGIFGLFTYLGAFAAAFKKFYERAANESLYVLGIMMIIGYAANDFFSFQQIVTTPIIFVVLGMLEGHSRMAGR